MIPPLFIAHGSPMIAIEDSEYSSFLDRLGSELPTPKAIVLFSAHWESDVQMVSHVDTYSTIYDFGGFPEALYRVKYPAPGKPALATKITSLLAQEGIASRLDKERGLDHGAWAILHRMFPKADIPVVAMSVNAHLAPVEQYRIGQALSGLRDEGVMVIGSGVTVHNFQLLHYRHDPEVKKMILEFETWLENHIQSWDLPALFNYEKLAPHARIAVPAHGQEHFVPLFYAMGAADSVRRAETLHRSLLMDVMVNTVYKFD